MKDVNIFVKSGKDIKKLTFSKVVSFELKKGFLCLTLSSGKFISYNLRHVINFEVD